MFTQTEIVKNSIIKFTGKNEGELVFKVEIWQESDEAFVPVLYKRGVFRLKSTGEAESIFADEILWVDACHLLSDNATCLSVEEGMQKISASFSRHFDIEK